MRRFFADSDSFAEDKIVLGKDETRHLRDVLRLAEGDEVAVFDGTGFDYTCVIENMSKKATILAISSKHASPSNESPLSLVMCVAFTKGDKFEFVIQKCVELGVTKLIPLITERCDVKLHDKTESKMDRWKKIVIESSKQCGRGILMQISEPKSFDALIQSPEKGETMLFSERDGESISDFKPAKELSALIGPEGGWSDAELEAAKESGVRIITLGGRILRAETAAVSIATILQHRCGDIN
jgi:16S rRNA (uracil1498-N3)-methyltransferase